MAATKMINRINESLKSQVISNEEAKSLELKKTKFSDYKEAMEKKTVLSVTFDTADTEGNLSAVDSNGVILLLEYDTFHQNLTYYSASIRSKFIATEITCRITSIDEENGIVNLQSFKTFRKDIKGAIIAEVCRELEKNKAILAEEAAQAKDKEDGKEDGESKDKETTKGKQKKEEPAPSKAKPIRVFGRVSHIAKDDNIAYVDILCRGIVGSIEVKKWQKTYLRRISTQCREGEIYEFEIIKAVKKNDHFTKFVLSRENITPDPWEAFINNENTPAVGDVVVAKIVDVQEGFDYMWGVCPRYPGIEVKVKKNPKLQYRVGISYKCKIGSLNPQEHKLSVTPFEVANESEAVVKFLKR